LIYYVYSLWDEQQFNPRLKETRSHWSILSFVIPHIMKVLVFLISLHDVIYQVLRYHSHIVDILSIKTTNKNVSEWIVVRVISQRIYLLSFFDLYLLLCLWLCLCEVTRTCKQSSYFAAQQSKFGSNCQIDGVVGKLRSTLRRDEICRNRVIIQPKAQNTHTRIGWWVVVLQLCSFIHLLDFEFRRLNVITSILQLILEHLKHRDEFIALTVVEVISTLTALIDSFNEINIVLLSLSLFLYHIPSPKWGTSNGFTIIIIILIVSLSL
jgi:hypothetical protein